MEALNQDFWNSRAEKYGHTGWTDRSVYQFDQAARLKCLKEIVAKTNVRANTALDFGAGTGDFSRMLAGTFKEVVAFEIAEAVLDIAKQNNASISNIRYERNDSVLNLEVAEESLDLILSVTVLGHILSESSLAEHLAYFFNKLNQEGVVVAMEYTPQAKLENNAYQRFLSKKDWIAAFEKQNFVLKEEFGFYSPTEAPCDSYLEYQNKSAVKLFKRTRGMLGSEKTLRNVANAIVDKSEDYFWTSRKDDLITVMLFKKS